MADAVAGRGQGSAPEGERLQKILAAAGYGSRRKSEVLIDQGRVSIDGEIVLEQGRRADPGTQVIRVDGKRIQAPAGVTVIALNKPKNVLTAMEDERGRPHVGELVPKKPRLFHIGRLDSDTTGLLLLSNDGDLAHVLTHPSFGVKKRYVATVEGELTSVDLKRLKDGVEVEGRAVEVSHTRLLSAKPEQSVIELEIHEGRNRIVRKLLAEIGHPVLELTRTRFGSVSIDGIAPGRTRHLSPDEVAALVDTVDQGQKVPGAGKKRQRKGKSKHHESRKGRWQK